MTYLTYRDLTRRVGAPPGSSWGLFGATGQLGTLNFLSDERTAAAAGPVRRGTTFNLDYPLNTFVPSLAGTRPATEHHIFANNPNHRDDNPGSREADSEGKRATRLPAAKFGLDE